MSLRGSFGEPLSSERIGPSKAKAAAEPMCEASKSFGYDREGLVCTLPKGHDGEHVDHGESIAWRWIDEIPDPPVGD